MRNQDEGRRGQPLQDRVPLPGAEDEEQDEGRRGQPLQDRPTSTEYVRTSPMDRKYESRGID